MILSNKSKTNLNLNEKNIYTFIKREKLFNLTVFVFDSTWNQCASNSICKIVYYIIIIILRKKN